MKKNLQSTLSFFYTKSWLKFQNNHATYSNRLKNAHPKYFVFERCPLLFRLCFAFFPIMAQFHFITRTKLMNLTFGDPRPAETLLICLQTRGTPYMGRTSSFFFFHFVSFRSGRSEKPRGVDWKTFFSLLAILHRDVLRIFIFRIFSNGKIGQFHAFYVCHIEEARVRWKRVLFHFFNNNSYWIYKN